MDPVMLQQGQLALSMMTPEQRKAAVEKAMAQATPEQRKEMERSLMALCKQARALIAAGRPAA